MLFPSWRFFEEITEIPFLEYRLWSSEEEWGPWKKAFTKLPRQATALFFNPQVNFALACQSVLQQLESDIGELRPGEEKEFPESASFQLVQALAEYQIRKLEKLGGSFRFQFRVSRLLQGAREDQKDTFLISEALEVLPGEIKQ